MSIDITFTLREQDLDIFRELVKESMGDIEQPQRQQEILDAAGELVVKAGNAEIPSFIADRLLILADLLNMLQDDEWQLDEEQKRSITGALSYFANSADLIPDDIPGIGFLDDALYAEIIAQELEEELRTYREFCQFRIAEENRRRQRGLDTKVGREDWLADKRAALHSRLRTRRAGRRSSGGWRTGILG